MDGLLDNEDFRRGVQMGVALYQQKVVAAHEQKKPLKIAENLFYLETGRERLERMLREICR